MAWGMRNLISTQAIDGAARAGNVERAHAIYAQFLPLLVFEQQPGVGIRKEVYRLRGLIECGRVRRPAPQVSTVAAAALAAQIERSLYDPFPGVDLTKPLTPSSSDSRGRDSTPASDEIFRVHIMRKVLKHVRYPRATVGRRGG